MLKTFSSFVMISIALLRASGSNNLSVFGTEKKMGAATGLSKARYQRAFITFDASYMALA